MPMDDRHQGTTVFVLPMFANFRRRTCTDWEAFWIGGSDREWESDFYWTDGSKVVFTSRWQFTRSMLYTCCKIYKQPFFFLKNSIFLHRTCKISDEQCVYRSKWIMQLNKNTIICKNFSTKNTKQTY